MANPARPATGYVDRFLGGESLECFLRRTYWDEQLFTREIAALLQQKGARVTRYDIAAWMRYLGIDKRTTSQTNSLKCTRLDLPKYQVNEAFFDALTPASAYVAQ